MLYSVLFIIFIGRIPSLKRLRPDAVPSIFPWTKEENEKLVERRARAESRLSRKRKRDDMCREELEASFSEEMDHVEEAVIDEAEIYYATPVASERTFGDLSTQTHTFPMFSIDNLKKDDKAIHFYTELETYNKFSFVLNTLGPAAYYLNYINFQVVDISIEDQFFVTLMKLRRYTTNFELSRFFSVSEPCE